MLTPATCIAAIIIYALYRIKQQIAFKTPAEQLSEYLNIAGTINGIAAMETVMTHIAHELNMDPWDVKKINFALGSGGTPQ